MSSITIGKDENGKSVKLDLPVLLRTHLQIQGASGSGKSWLVRLLAEQLFGKVPVIIIDQEGEYATLREKFDYVLVGKGGEAAASTASASLLAHRLLELQASAVVDLYDLDIPTRKIWVKNFFEGVMSAPKKHWRPTVFIVDEAHDFIPEKMESACAGILASAISKGRKRGFAFVCATQRLSKINKDVASELQNVLIGKTWLDIDRDRAISALGINGTTLKNAFNEEVKRLAQGQFFAQGAAISMDRLLLTSGPVQTSHPDSSRIGAKKAWLTPPPTPKAVAALLGKLEDLPKEAADEAKTVSELNKAVVQLKRDLKIARAGAPAVLPQRAADSSKPLERLQEAQKSTKLDLERVKADAAQLRKLLKTNLATMAKASAILLDSAKVLVPEGPVVKDVPLVHTPQVRNAVPISYPISRIKVSKSISESEAEQGGINNKQRHILRALAEFLAIGRTAVPRNWVAARSGASHRSSAYANNVSNLRSRGLIEYTGDGIQLTDSGQTAAPVVDIPLTTQAMKQSCMAMLVNKQQSILEYLHEIYPDSADRSTVAQNSGASELSSAYANNVSALKSAGMIDYMPDRTLKAASWMFID